MDEGCEITSVIENQVQRLAARERSERLLDAPRVLLFSLALPRINGDSGRSNAMV